MRWPCQGYFQPLGCALVSALMRKPAPTVGRWGPSSLHQNVPFLEANVHCGSALALKPAPPRVGSLDAIGDPQVLLHVPVQWLMRPLTVTW